MDLIPFLKHAQDKQRKTVRQAEREGGRERDGETDKRDGQKGGNATTESNERSKDPCNAKRIFYGDRPTDRPTHQWTER